MRRPLLYFRSTLHCTAISNFLFMERNGPKCTYRFPYFVNTVTAPDRGNVKAPHLLPGIGAGIKPELFKNGDAIATTVAKL